ncbi:class I adenylate-forming enzyme family protein [Nocardioides albus]|nr:AMP-binding protein [Nocardioides albus]
MTNLVGHIWRHADESPDRPGLRDGDRSWTFGQMRSRITTIATDLRERGVAIDDRVLMVLPTSAEFVFIYHALLSLGATPVTVNPLCAPREIEYFIEDAGCSLAISWDESTDAVATATTGRDLPLWVVSSGEFDALPDDVPPDDLVDVDPDHAAVLLYTSGTTGKPKGAVLTHRNLIFTGDVISRVLETGPQDVMGTALPLFHVFGQGSVMASVYTAGSCFSVIRPFDPVKVLDTVAEHRLTGLSGVPTMWMAMLHAETDRRPEEFAQLRVASSGGAAMPVEVAKAFKARFGATILDGYGLSETTGGGTVNLPEGLRKEGSVGQALPGTKIAILDPLGKQLPVGEVGEVALSGPMVMREYWNRPDATAAARSGEWFLSGDLGRVDDDGHVYIVDRKKDLVIRGGYNVYPREVEEVLYSHPAIRQAAVVGVPDERLGEEVAAVYAVVDGASLEPGELRAWLADKLAAYKIPRLYQEVQALPTGATGKILKRGIDRNSLLTSGTRTSRQTTPTG